MQQRPDHRARARVALVLLVPLCILLASCARPVAVPAPHPRAAAATPRVMPSPATAVNRVLTFPSAAGQRFAIVHHPATVRRGAPLVVVINGAYGTAQQAKAAWGWDGMADRNGFVVAYPNASGPLWNAGNCCGQAHAKGVDDVGFLHTLLQRLQTEDGVDARRVFAVGISNGAMMAYGWACARPDDLAGIGVVAGALVANCAPAPALTVVAIHGTADRNVPINGGVGPLSVTHYRYPSVAASITPFVAADSCSPQPTVTHRPLVTLNTWSCGEHTVMLAVVAGMGHIWPGARSQRPASQKRLMSQTPVALDATTFLWTNLRTARSPRPAA